MSSKSRLILKVWLYDINNVFLGLGIIYILTELFKITQGRQQCVLLTYIFVKRIEKNTFTKKSIDIVTFYLCSYKQESDFIYLTLYIIFSQ